MTLSNTSGWIVLGIALTQVWPLKQLRALYRIRSGAFAATAKRPIPRSDGSGPSWGPLTPSGIKGMHLGDVFYGVVGLLVYLYTWPETEKAKEWPTDLESFAASWVMAVLCRNLLFEVAFYEFWHQMLFGCLATQAVTKHRYSEASPYEAEKPGGKPQMNIWRERFWCTCGFIWSTAWECYIVHAWASGYVPKCDDTSGLLASGGGAGPFGIGCQMSTPSSFDDLKAKPLSMLWFLLAFPLTTQFRGIHFFAVHRAMHPWFGRRKGLKDGDIGAFLYRWVHSLHHKSYNPGPWSSLSMHPVEHLFYFSCFLLAFLVPYHPLHLLLNKYHTDLSALAGHDGYGQPGADDVGHYLHHKHFECNYGFSFPNYLDRLFDTYENGDRFLPAKEREKLGLSTKISDATDPDCNLDDSSRMLKQEKRAYDDSVGGSISKRSRCSDASVDDDMTESTPKAAK